MLIFPFHFSLFKKIIKLHSFHNCFQKLFLKFFSKIEKKLTKKEHAFLALFKKKKI